MEEFDIGLGLNGKDVEMLPDFKNLLSEPPKICQQGKVPAKKKGRL